MPIKVRVRRYIVDQLQLWSYLAAFQKYGDLLAENRKCYISLF